MGVAVGMEEMGVLLERWGMDEAEVRRRIYRVPTPRERERRHALWLLAQDWAAAVAHALERDAHTIGQWATAFAERGPAALAFEQSGASPPLNEEQQAEFKGTAPGSPSQGGIDLSNWNWKVVRRFVEERFGLSLCRSSCLNYLHRLGFVLKRPKKRLVKADLVRREAFVSEYAALTAAARRTGVKIFFADEPHFRADADLRGKWVLKGEPALVESTSPRRGEKASYYSAVCLETGEVEVMELEGNSNSATSAAFLPQLRVRHYETLTVNCPKSPAHRGDALRAYLATPDLNLCLVNLPSYSPDCSAPILAQSHHMGLGAPGGDYQPVPGYSCRSAGESGRLLRPPVQPSGGSETALPKRATNTSGTTDWQLSSRHPPPCK